MAVNIGAELQALPLEYMLGAPLAAAIKGQALAAQTTVDFIEKVGLVENDDGDMVVRNVQFEYSKQFTNPEDPAAVPSISKHELTVPMLAIVPIPYIRIEDLNVEFEFKVRETITKTSKSEVTAGGGTKTVVDTTTKLGGGFLSFLGGPSATIKANVTSTFNVSTSYKSSNKQTQDRSARFSMNMKAVQDNMPEGLSRVLNILNDAITSEEKVS
jgi:hypothetical protein